MVFVILFLSTIPSMKHWYCYILDIIMSITLKIKSENKSFFQALKLQCHGIGGLLFQIWVSWILRSLLFHSKYDFVSSQSLYKHVIGCTYRFIKLPRYPVIPRKFLTFSFDSNVLHLSAAFCGSGFNACDVNRCPINIISLLSNLHFIRSNNLILYSLALCNTFSSVLLYSLF